MKLVISNKSMIPIELEIMNSQPEFNLLSVGKEQLTEKEILEEHEEELEKERYLIEENGKYIGILEFIMRNPKDEKPWLGLLIIHKAWTKQSYAQQAFDTYIGIMKERNVKEVRLGCLEGNDPGQRFWDRNGFVRVKKTLYNNRPLWILEKKL